MLTNHFPPLLDTVMFLAVPIISPGRQAFRHRDIADELVSGCMVFLLQRQSLDPAL
jgi:hypothetical protein